ncbi:septum formation family protein [Micromonospora sp. KLBMP9576]|uniref:septum formation family protein n=1 Tax=Micromonospora sp. KLBMP9576 TaxID=3424769 RepID=UPI003D92CF1A
MGGQPAGRAEDRTPLAHGCAVQDRWGHLLPAPCTKTHHFEYVGIWTAPDVSYDDATEKEDAVHAKCRPVIARYAKVPVDG